MELRHLRYFKAVAETLNFSRAAEQLRVAQPALSRQVRALEEELGTLLFERAHGVRLTDAGRVFYTHTCKILGQVDVAVAAAAEAAGGTGGELTVCNEWRLAGQFLPQVVAEFRRRFPRVDLTLLDLQLAQQLAAIRERRAQVGFVVTAALRHHTELEWIPVQRAPLVAALPASHPLATRTELRLADLAVEKWVMLDEKEAPGYRAFVTRLCRQHGFPAQFGPSASTAEGVVGRVASGYGVALMFAANAPHHNPLVRAIPLDVPPLELCAVWHRRDKSPLLHAFLKVVKAQAAPQ